MKRSLVALLIALAGCVEAGVSTAEWTDDLTAAELPERVLREAEWDRVFRIGGTLQDTLFWNPYHLVAAGGTVVVLDAVARRAVGVDSSGTVRWITGRGGSGPGEFEAPSDIAVGPHGSFHILDRKLLRMTVVTPDGRVERTVPLEEGPGLPDRIAAVGDSGYLLISPTSDQPIWRYDADGRLDGTAPFPWEPFLRIPAIPRVFVTGAGAGDGRWVAAFNYGTGLFLMDGTRSESGRLPVPELVRFPGMITRELSDGGILRRVADPQLASMGVALSPDRIYVLFAGETELRRRLLDSYDRGTGRYIESWVLPHRVSQVAWYEGAIYLIRTQPYPALEAWRPLEGALP